MSRSYKHTPICTDGRAGGPKRAKRTANKKVRRLPLEELPSNGKTYKKYYEKYDIHDWWSIESLHNALIDWERNCWNIQSRYKSKRDYIHKWFQNHRMK